MDDQIPIEIWLMIFSLLDKSDWKQIRLSCQHLAQLATTVLFEAVYFELCGSRCISLYNIAMTPALARCVKTLTLRRVHSWREFPDFLTWRRSVCQPDEPSDIAAHPAVSSGDCHVKAAEGLLPHIDWVSLSSRKKEDLYHEYETDRRHVHEDIRSMTSELRFHMPDFPESVLVHPYRAWTERKSNGPVRLFVKALEKLPNLCIFRHEPGFIVDPDWGCRWRGLYFHPVALAKYTSQSEDEDIEALQLSVALHCLAIASKEHARLRSLSMYAGGPSFWGPARLQHLWAGGGHERTRDHRSICRNAAEADKVAFSVSTNYEQRRLYSAQLHWMRYALSSLVSLDCTVSEDDEHDGSLAIAGKHLLELLNCTTNLMQIRLVFGSLANGILPLGSDRSLYAQDSIALLNELARRTLWTKIRSMDLELATDGLTLIRFLLVHKATLRSLKLTRVSLSRLESSVGTWESVLVEISHALSLEDLALTQLCDFVPLLDSEGTRRRVLFDAKDAVWQDGISQYQIHYQTVINRILLRESFILR